jgi:hypothetical protein
MKIDASDSLWTIGKLLKGFHSLIILMIMLEDDELHINLQKMYKAELWACVFKGHGELDAFTKEEVQKKLMLERFQAEVSFSKQLNE